VKQNGKSRQPTIRKSFAPEFLENDHAADSVRKFPALIARTEQDWQFLRQKKWLGFDPHEDLLYPPVLLSPPRLLRCWRHVNEVCALYSGTVCHRDTTVTLRLYFGHSPSLS